MDALQGPVAVLWDIENCGIPRDVQPADVATNIRKSLGGGTVTTFSAYGDFSSFPRNVREGCQRTGVKLVDVPNGRKDAADKAILVDMFLFALDNRPPSSVMLISGDVDFSHALHILGQRGYTIILGIPSGVRVSSALRNAGKFVWDWPSIARGAGAIPSAGLPTTLPPRVRPNETSSHLMGCQQIWENQDGMETNSEVIRLQKTSQSPYNGKGLLLASQSLSKNLNKDSSDLPSSLSAEVSFKSLTPSLNKATPSPLAELNDATCLVKLPEQSDKGQPSPAVTEDKKDVQDMNEGDDLVSGSTAQLSDVSKIVLEKNPVEIKEDKADNLSTDGAVGETSGAECKVPDPCSNPTRVSEVLWPASNVLGYGAHKFGNLLQKFSDVRSLNKQDEVKTFQNVNGDAHLVFGSFADLSEDKEVALKENFTVEEVEKMVFQLKGQLVKLLEHSGGCLAVAKILPEYQRLFERPLHISDYGTSEIVNLLQEFSDVMSIEGEDSKEVVVYLKNFHAETAKGIALVSSLFEDKGGEEKQIQNGNDDSRLVSTSTDELTDDFVVPQESSSKGNLKERSLFTLKGELVKLLEQYEGCCLALAQIPTEYQKLFGQPLCAVDDGAFNLTNLLQKFSDEIGIEGEGEKKFVHLKKCRASPNINEKGKGIQNANDDARLVSGTSNELSDFNKRVVPEVDSPEKIRQRINMFQLVAQLINLLEQSGGSIAFNKFSQEYHKLFGRQLCVKEYDACNLMDLLQKFSYVMRIEGEGLGRMVYLKNYQAGTSNGTVPPSTSLSKDTVGRGKRIQNVHSVSDLLEYKKVVVEENTIDEKQQRKAMFRVRGQLIKLLVGGSLAFNQIPQGYKELYGRNLCVSEYGAFTLLDLLQKFSSVMTVEGESAERVVYLKKSPAGGTKATPKYKERMGNGIKNTNYDAHSISGSSDGQKVLVEENSIDGKQQRKAMFRAKGQLMKQLVNLLVQSGGCLALTDISSDYRKLYGEPLRLSDYGASNLVDLLENFSKVMIIVGEGLKGLVCLKNYRADAANGTVPPSPSQSIHLKGNDIPTGNENAHLESHSVATEGKGKDILLLKMQTVDLLKQCGGCLDLSVFRQRYQQLYGQPLCLSEYGDCKLMDLLQRFSDFMSVEGEAPVKLVRLKNYSRTIQLAPPPPMAH